VTPGDDARRTRLVLLAFVCATLAGQDAVTIKTGPHDTARPLSTLVSQLRKREHVPISYEDPRYGKRTDMQGPEIAFKYSARDLERPNGAELTVDRMLREYAASGGLIFGVKKEAMRLYVVPEEVISGNNGKYHAVPGYDLVTGWGSPTGPNLINALTRTNAQ
jgi:hypothetical protein